MRFEERELKPYAEPVRPDELQIGEVYFALQFLDDDMLFPILEPKVFVGRNLEAEDQDEFYFQDFESHRRGIRYDTATPDDDSVFETGAENHTFPYERALDQLMVCALRRRSFKPKTRNRIQ